MAAVSRWPGGKSSFWLLFALFLLPPSGWMAAGPPQSADAAWIVAVDPGHGGDDYGVRTSSGIFEKDINLAYALALRQALEQKGGITVLLTRSGDSQAGLEERAVMANRAGAALLISLHAGASFTPAGSGFHAFYFQPETADLETFQARRRTVGGRELRLVPWELAQVPWLALSRDLAGSLQSRLDGLYKTGEGAPLGEKLYLLSYLDCPAVIMETGYLSNPADEEKLQDPAHRQAFCQAVAETVAEFLKSRLPLLGDSR